MKKMIFAVASIATAFTFGSCGSAGWTEDTKKSAKSLCEFGEKMSYDDADATAICDCYIESLVKKFPKAEYTPEQGTAEMEACQKGFESTTDKKLKQQLEESMSTDMSGAEGALEDAVEGAVEDVKEAAKH